MPVLEHDYFFKLFSKINGEEYCNASGGISSQEKLYCLDFKDNIFDLIFLAKNQLYNNGYTHIHINPNIDINTVRDTLTTIFGLPMIDQSGEEIATINYKLGGQYFAKTNLTQPLHTDNGHTTNAPRILVLYCQHSSKIGGESILVSFEQIYNALNTEWSGQLEDLFDKDAIKVLNVDAEISKNILFNLDDNRVGITYSPILKKLEASDSVCKKFNLITQFVHNPANQIRFKLVEGDLLIVDNARMLHSRAKFPADANRLIYRIWFKDFYYVG